MSLSESVRGPLRPTSGTSQASVSLSHNPHGVSQPDVKGTLLPGTGARAATRRNASSPFLGPPASSSPSVFLLLPPPAWRVRRPVSGTLSLALTAVLSGLQVLWCLVCLRAAKFTLCSVSTIGRKRMISCLRSVDSKRTLGRETDAGWGTSSLSGA